MPGIDEGADRASRLERLLVAVGEAALDVAEDIAELRTRLVEGRFHLAVLGQFKRGKSTLLNALLGDRILPTSVVPVTAIPTFIRPAPTTALRVVFADGRPPLEREDDGCQETLVGYVTEEGNPNNRCGVAFVELYHPSPLLDRGVVLIDTPGIGSTFRHNTEATLNFIPQCDAALFVVSADPPITEVEVEFLEHVRSKVAHTFFLLNKVDYLDDDERRQAEAFLRRVLTERVGLPADSPLFCVSARNGLEARLRHDVDAWCSSGMADVERHLVEFLAGEKAAALCRAVARRADDILGSVLMGLRLQLQSLRLPIDDLQRRAEEFEQAVDAARSQRITARDLLNGDHRRVHEFLEDHAATVRAEARAYLDGVVEMAVGESDEVEETSVRAVVAEAVQGYFEHRVGETTELFRVHMAEVLEPHRRRAEDLVRTIRTTASQLFDIPCHVPAGADDYRMVRQPYWVTNEWTSSIETVTQGLVDRLLPTAVRRRRTMDRLRRQISSLVVPNVENLRWATVQGIDQTFIRFGNALDRSLEETITTTYGAVRTVLFRRNACQAAVADETARIRAAVVKLEQLQGELRTGE